MKTTVLVFQATFSSCAHVAQVCQRTLPVLELHGHQPLLCLECQVMCLQEEEKLLWKGQQVAWQEVPTFLLSMLPC